MTSLRKWFYVWREATVYLHAKKKGSLEGEVRVWVQKAAGGTTHSTKEKGISAGHFYHRQKKGLK